MSQIKETWAAGDAGLPQWMIDMSKAHNLGLDTSGWRDIRSLLASGWSASKLQVMRRGWDTFLIMRGLSGPGDNIAYNFVTGLPAAWMPVADRVIYPLSGATQFTIGTGGQIGTLGTTTTFTTVDVAFQWEAKGAFTTTFPGVVPA